MDIESVADVQKWQIEVDLCSVGASCGKKATTERRFDWQIAGATFLQIYLRVCDDHAAVVDGAEGAPFPVSCVVTEDC